MKTKPRLPITGPLLVKIQEALARSGNPDKVLIWAICSLAFFGLFRLGELLLESPSAYNPSMPAAIRVHLKQSKCNQLGKGVDITIGQTNSPLCPVTAVLSYIRLRQDAPGAFFTDKQCQPVRKSWFIQQLRHIPQSMGLHQEH